MQTIATPVPKIIKSQYHHFTFIWAEDRIAFSRTLICLSSSLLSTPEASLPVKVRDNGQDPDNDEINPYEIVKYLGKNHYNDAENERDYAHP
jgi:hypothetical protein